MDKSFVICDMRSLRLIKSRTAVCIMLTALLLLMARVSALEQKTLIASARERIENADIAYTKCTVGVGNIRERGLVYLDGMNGRVYAMKGKAPEVHEICKLTQNEYRSVIKNVMRYCMREVSDLEMHHSEWTLTGRVQFQIGTFEITRPILARYKKEKVELLMRLFAVPGGSTTLAA